VKVAARFESIRVLDPADLHDSKPAIRINRSSLRRWLSVVLTRKAALVGISVSVGLATVDLRALVDDPGVQ
jgi:hypothetical protein